MKVVIELIIQKILSFINRASVRLTDQNSLKDFLGKLSPVKFSGGLLRLGPDGDGGYLVPNDLNDIGACFSPGVSFVSGFEKECAERGMKIFLADRSVDGPAENHDLFSFTKHFIGSYTTEGFLTIDGWVNDSVEDNDTDLMLQIDIEGFEYEVIDDIIKHNIKPKQILLEFHHFYPTIGNIKTELYINKIKKYGYNLFYVSNNFCEFSFILI